MIAWIHGCCPVAEREDRTIEKQLELLNQQGFSRILVNGDARLIEEVLDDKGIGKIVKNLL